MWFLYQVEKLKLDKKDQSSLRKNTEANLAKEKEDVNASQSRSLRLEDFKEKPCFWHG